MVRMLVIIKVLIDLELRLLSILEYWNVGEQPALHTGKLEAMFEPPTSELERAKHSFTMPPIMSMI